MRPNWNLTAAEYSFISAFLKVLSAAESKEISFSSMLVRRNSRIEHRRKGDGPMDLFPGDLV